MIFTGEKNKFDRHQIVLFFVFSCVEIIGSSKLNYLGISFNSSDNDCKTFSVSKSNVAINQHIKFLKTSILKNKVIRVKLLQVPA